MYQQKHFKKNGRLTLFVLGWLTTGMVFSSANAQSVGSPKKQTGKVNLLQREVSGLRNKLRNLSGQKKSQELNLQKLSEELDILQKKQDEQGVSADSFAEILKTLQAQRVDLLIDLAGMNARREAVFEIKNRIEKESDSIVADLTQLLELEQEELARAEKLFERSTLSKKELVRAKARLLEVKIRLAEAKRPDNSSSLLNDALLNASLDRAEKKARLEKIESLLATFTDSRSSLEQSLEVQNEINDAKRSVATLNAGIVRTTEQIDQLTAQIAELTGKEERSRNDEQ